MTSPPSPEPPTGYARSRMFLAIVVTAMFVALVALAAIFWLADVIAAIGHYSQGVRTWWEDLT
jgi:hypothetical protein